MGAVLVVVLALAGAAHADHAGEMKARESFAAGRFDEALELFAKLYAETLNPIYLRNIGRCHQKLRQPDKAIDAFHDYLAKGKKISADERAEIQGYIKEMEALRDEQAKQVTPAPPAPVQPLAGASAAGAPPSGYPAAAPGYAAPPPADYGTQPAGALVAQPAPQSAESSPVYTRWWFWTIIGAAVVGGVVAAVLISGGTTKPACPTTAVGCQ